MKATRLSTAEERLLRWRKHSGQARVPEFTEAFYDLPEAAPDWGTEPDVELSISDSVNQRISVWRRRSPIDWDRRVDIYAKHLFRCLYCGARPDELVIDHIVPVAMGGDSQDRNLAPACRDCNLSKRAKSLAEWVRETKINPEEILKRWREAGREEDLRVVA